MTLAELLTVMVLISGVFLMITIAYTAGLRQWNSFFVEPGRLNTYNALNEISRAIRVANDAVVTEENVAAALNQDGTHLKLRWDYPNPPNPNNTPNGNLGTMTTADDSWISYAFIDGVLYRKRDNVSVQPPLDIAIGDPGLEIVQPGLIALEGSGFALLNPTGGASLPTLVRITLVTNIGGNQKTIQTVVTVGAKAKN